MLPFWLVLSKCWMILDMFGLPIRITGDISWITQQPFLCYTFVSFFFNGFVNVCDNGIDIILKIQGSIGDVTQSLSKRIPFNKLNAILYHGIYLKIASLWNCDSFHDIRFFFLVYIFGNVFDTFITFECTPFQLNHVYFGLICNIIWTQHNAKTKWSSNRDRQYNE